jgi:hypothetical protein
MSNFESVLQSIAQNREIFNISAKDAIDKLLQFDDRVDLDSRLDSFSFTELELYNEIKKNLELKIESEIIQTEGTTLAIKYNAFGRLNIRSIDDEMPDYGNKLNGFVIGYINMPTHQYKNAIEEAKEEEKKEIPYQKKIDVILSTLETNGELETVFKNIRGSIGHLEAILFYIDDRWYRHMEGSSNLVSPKEELVLDKLEKAPISEWSREDRLAIIGLQSMFLSGKTRPEEVNGVQLRPSWLYSRFEELVLRYTTIFSYTLKIPSDLLKRASLIDELSKNISGRGFLRYRSIEGPTFRKIEKITPIQTEEEMDKMVPDFINETYKLWLNEDVPTDHKELFIKMADYAITNDVQNGNSKYVEELTRVILKSNLIQTRSSVALSSAFRNPGLLFNDDINSLRDFTVDTRNKDFYTCVMCHKDFANRLNSKQIKKISTMLQMRLNRIRWGYLPANFPLIEIPEKRYYLYPSIMPDISTFGDLHHKSHTIAEVRNNIRTQGPDNALQPLMINNIPYRGFHDIRIYRAGDEPYTLDDMKTSRTHNYWIDIMWRRIIIWCTVDENIRKKFKIIGFDKGDHTVEG